jgi:hypothetical protein
LTRDGQLAAQLASWFMAYAGARTLANSLEATLVATSLALWPWSARSGVLTAASVCVPPRDGQWRSNPAAD